MAKRRSTGKRAAPRPPRRALSLPSLGSLRPRGAWGSARGAGIGFGALIVVGLCASLSKVLGLGPEWLDQLGAVCISTGIAAVLAARAGGRPAFTAVLALALGCVALWTDSGPLRGGAAVATAAGTAVLAVLATVPAVRFRHAVREVLVAGAIGLVGSFAVVGFRPTTSPERFDYVSLAVAFVLALALVYRLGAGLGGLGRRGAVVLAGGALLIAFAIAYAELLRAYGPDGFLDQVFSGVRWWRDHLGAVPRPTVLFVGVPALVWGCHMRARRRQGWWVAVFGVCLSVSVATLWLNPETGWGEGLLILLYSVVPGVGLGYLAVRLDLALTGPRGQRARRAEEASAVRPEPRRFSALL